MGGGSIFLIFFFSLMVYTCNPLPLASKLHPFPTLCRVCRVCSRVSHPSRPHTLYTERKSATVLKVSKVSKGSSHLSHPHGLDTFTGAQTGSPVEGVQGV
jgi:hypothetical protein